MSRYTDWSKCPDTLICLKCPRFYQVNYSDWKVQRLQSVCEFQYLYCEITGMFIHKPWLLYSLSAHTKATMKCLLLYHVCFEMSVLIPCLLWNAYSYTITSIYKSSTVTELAHSFWDIYTCVPEWNNVTQKIKIILMGGSFSRLSL